MHSYQLLLGLSLMAVKLMQWFPEKMCCPIHSHEELNAMAQQHDRPSKAEIAIKNNLMWKKSTPPQHNEIHAYVCTEKF